MRLTIILATECRDSSPNILKNFLGYLSIFSGKISQIFFSFSILPVFYHFSMNGKYRYLSIIAPEISIPRVVLAILAPSAKTTNVALPLTLNYIFLFPSFHLIILIHHHSRSRHKKIKNKCMFVAL